MKKRALILAVGLCIGLAVTGCNENEENAESSLESLVESTEVETETGIKTTLNNEADKETIFNMQPTGGEGCIPPYEVTEEETSEDDFTPDSKIIKAGEDEWVDDCDLSELPEVPYKEKLNKIIGNELETDYGFDWNWENRDGEYFHKWIDCGMYYKVKDVDIISSCDGESSELDFDMIEHFDELYLLKEGEYRYNGIDYTDLDKCLEENMYVSARFSLKFNEKGYIIGFVDAAVS